MKLLERLGALLAVATLALNTPAGDLDPPGSPVSTSGPEPRIAVNSVNTPGDATSRYRISAQGSYYLTGNLSFSAGQNMISIGASNVTLDLNGFRLGRDIFIGDPPLSGIVADLNLENVVIRNGIIRGFTEDGIDVYSVRGARIENIIASDNGLVGIQVGFEATVHRCGAFRNGSTGIRADAESRVTECSAIDNEGSGIVIEGVGGVAEGCTAAGNSANGIGAPSGGNWRVADNTCRGNASHGIDLCGGNLITGNLCADNGSDSGVEGAGIRVRCADNRVDGNHVEGNEVGIRSSENMGNVVTRNTALSSSVANYQGTTGNDFGPISSAATATSPWANITD